MVAKSTRLTEMTSRYKAEAVRACIAYALQDASELGLVTAALHLKLAIMEIDDALAPDTELKQVS